MDQRGKHHHRRRAAKETESPAKVHERQTSEQPGKPTISTENHASNVGQREPREDWQEIGPDDHDDEGT
jgi:hypothetical protein